MAAIHQMGYAIQSTMSTHTTRLQCHKCLPEHVFNLSKRMYGLVSMNVNFSITDTLDFSPLLTHIHQLNIRTKSNRVCIPPQLGVAELHILAEHNCTLAMPVAPKSLKKLRLENALIACSDFGSIMCLDFGNTITELPAATALPTALKQLHLGVCFCGLLDDLPERLEVLHIGNGVEGGAFNVPLDHLPANLRDLAMAGVFNQPIDHLSASLTSLNLAHSDFDWPIDHLPVCLTSLSLGLSFGRPIAYLPAKVRHLEVPWVCSSEISYDFSDCRELEGVTIAGDARGTVAEITIPNSVSNIVIHSKGYPHFRYCSSTEPTNLACLELWGRDVTIGERALCTHELLNSVENYDHPALTAIRFPNWFDAPVDNLPINLRDLTLGAAFNRSVDHLPAKLANIRFDPCGILHSIFDRPLDNLPIGLQSIAFIGPSVFNQPVDHLPESLHSLVLYETSPNEASAAASTQYMSTSYAKNARRLQSCSFSCFSNPINHFMSERHVYHEFYRF
jgi:hypothetical protein